MIEDNQSLVILSVIIFPLMMALSWWMTGRILGYAIKNAIIDYPNERSSHDIPKPRGGGIGIAIVCIVCTSILYIFDLLPFPFVMAALPGGLLIAFTGWLDDKYRIKISVRMVIYLISSLWACYWLILNGMKIDAVIIIVFFICAVGITWLTNLYNFMDGTDGFAAIEAVSVSVLITILASLSGLYGLALINLVIIATTAGFLLWNWPPAKIFMGDTGSCYLGFVFGVMTVSSFTLFKFPVSVWLVLLSVFICDATLTLLKRILNREQWYKSHRSHSYQRLIQCGATHRQLLFGLLAINLLLLWPVAVLVFIYKNLVVDIVSLVLTVFFLVLLWTRIQGYYSRNRTFAPIS